MVEGPTAKAYAFRVKSEFCGEVVRDVFVRSRRVYVPVNLLFGRRLLDSDSMGKNILLFFGDVVIRVHLMMFGAIHFYRLDEALLKPERMVRLMIIGDSKRLVVYNAPIVEIDLKERVLERLRRELGPDPLSGEWDKERAIQNLMKFPEEKIGTVLLDQSAIAGVGNILRNEILFRAGMSPERKVKELTRDELERIADITKDLSEKFLELKMEKKGIKSLLLVYNRYRGSCVNCGSSIKFYMQKPVNRKTFICEKCQR
jgi:endonuclease-8